MLLMFVYPPLANHHYILLCSLLAELQCHCLGKVHFIQTYGFTTDLSCCSCATGQ
uniref:Uncharacterized protein n=1 Tax=Anguilla anguilla TaxID=7936 RepID=A0A0E9RTJ6_ANGAN